MQVGRNGGGGVGTHLEQVQGMEEEAARTARDDTDAPGVKGGKEDSMMELLRETDIPTTGTGDDDSFSILLFFTLHSAVQVLTLHQRFPAVQSDADIESSGIWVTKIWCDKVGFDTMVKMCMANGKRYWRCKISKQNPKH
ncbi:hypothetical protein BDZ91DRAFT_801313 [Kalaharituber pfeilii]|nr:hypothetical protein BDZ91DRAFT_801313 [Kalaharituber pfeilii]